MKSVFIVLGLALFLATGCTVYAQDSTKSAISPKNNLQQKAQLSKARFEERQAALKEKLKEFKDKRKANLAEKISNNLNRINEKRTSQMAKFLDNTERILNRLAERVDRANSAGKDTTTTKGAITQARDAIKVARNAVSAQKDKDYTITVNNETTIKTDAKATRDRLHTDLQVVRKLVIDAKQAVANAIKVAATTLGGVGEKSQEATKGAR